MRATILLLLVAPLVLANADPDPTAVAIPDAVKAMLDAALASGNEGEISTIVKYARVADPASADAVLAVAEKWRGDRDRARQERIAQASFLDLWQGRAELGGFLTTGNSDTLGVTGLVDLTREGIRWRNKFRAQIDYQESLNVTTRNHYLLSYEPNYKIDDRAYFYGAAQYESDRTQGYLDRYSVSAGAGYSAIKRPNLKLDVELGPAYRDTSFTDDTVQSSFAARGSMDFNWRLSPGLSVTQNASAYIQHFNSTVTGTTALNARLIGPLSASLSYNIQYESMPPVGSVGTNTTSRAGLVYSF